MRAFSELFVQLDSTTSTSAKEIALRNYFSIAPNADAAWAAYFLAGGTPKRLVKTSILRNLIHVGAKLPEWLFDECYESVGDLAETIALLLPTTAMTTNMALHEWVENLLMPLRTIPPEQQASYLLPLLEQLDTTGKFICLKLITGSFRVGVSRLTVIKALATLSQLDSKVIAQRMVGFLSINRSPKAEDFLALIQPLQHTDPTDRKGLPYPFFLAHPISHDILQIEQQLGSIQDWHAEWKWDGIRAQIVKRDGELWIWSRGEELITERFPEIASIDDSLPNGTVLDGELLVWLDDMPQPFALLQQRIGRLKLAPKLLHEIPVAFLAYDILEWKDEDVRQRSLVERNNILYQLIDDIRIPSLKISQSVIANSWQQLAEHRDESRKRGVEGLMLKHKRSQYGVGRTKNVGTWWKWKIDPLTIDAVLIYAQRGHGRRASLYTDYTFALWDKSATENDRKLLPFAKAYSGLTDAELREADQLIRKTTIERFGPVSTLQPTQVFEIGFEGIARSKRHKSGVSVRFPRILRWRKDKPIDEANTLADLQSLLPH